MLCGCARPRKRWAERTTTPPVFPVSWRFGHTIRVVIQADPDDFLARIDAGVEGMRFAWWLKFPAVSVLCGFGQLARRYKLASMKADNWALLTAPT
jgi:hypothetical protein